MLKNVAPGVSTRFEPSLFVTVTDTLPAEKMLSGPAPTVGAPGKKPACVMPSKPVPIVGASAVSGAAPGSLESVGGVGSDVNRDDCSTGRRGGCALSAASNACASADLGA